MVFYAFHNLYTPPKTPFFPTGPASLLILEHKIGSFVVVSMVFFPVKVDAYVLYTFTQNGFTGIFLYYKTFFLL